MPHVVIKLYPGRTDEQKTLLAGQIVKDVAAIAGCAEKSVSVAIELKKTLESRPLPAVNRKTHGHRA